MSNQENKQKNNNSIALHFLLLQEKKNERGFFYSLTQSAMLRAVSARLRSRGRPAWTWWLLDENNAVAIATVARVI